MGLLLALGGLSTSAAEPGGPGRADPQRIEKLIKDLGSNKFAERSKARQELKRIGEPALEALRKALKCDDAETRRAAGDLLKGIEARALTERLLAPKRVRLDMRDMPVPDAVAELSRQSGYRIELQGDQAALRARKVTLQTGETTFWEAFDRLCREAGLVEATPVNPYAYTAPARIHLPIQKIQPPPVQAPVPAPPGVKQPLGGKVQAAPAAAPVQVVQVIEVQPNAAGVPILVPVQIPIAAAAAAPVPFPPPARAAAGQRAPAVAPAPAPALPGGPVPARRTMPYALPASGQIVVQPGTPPKGPTSYAGAVRIRAVPPPPGAGRAEGDVTVTLQVTAEPRVEGFTVLGTPQLRKAIDDQGQSLTLADDAPASNPAGVATRVARTRYYPYGMAVVTGPQTVLLRLKAGAKQATALKELTGTLSAQVLAPPETLVKVDNVLKSAGKEVKAEGGEALQVLSITHEANGDYRVQVRMEGPQGGTLPGGMLAPAAQIRLQMQMQQRMQIQGGAVIVGGQRAGGPVSGGRPSLVDAAGKAYQLVAAPTTSMRVGGGTVSQEMTLVYRPHAGQGEPASLVLTGQRTVTVQIPFRLENVPLP
jgi:hypothetical protein